MSPSQVDDSGSIETHHGRSSSSGRFPTSETTMKNILQHIAEGIGILLITFLFHRQRKISAEMTVEQQDNTSEEP